MRTNIQNIIDLLTQIQKEHGDIHVRIMGQPIGGLSVRNMRKLYGDGWTAYHEVNIVGIEFCGVLKELSEDYQQLKPIPQVEKMIPND